MTQSQSVWPEVYEAECAFLGLALWHADLFPQFGITSQDFYREYHRAIYEAMCAIDADGDAIDPISVTETLKHQCVTDILGEDVYIYLLGLQKGEMETPKLESKEQRAQTYAKLIKEAAFKRQLYTKLTNAQAIALNGSKDPYADVIALLKELEPLVQQEENSRLVTGTKGKPILKSDSLEDVLNYPDPEYLLAKILEVATVSLLFGESGTGKTFLALAIALAVAFERDWLGRSVKQGPVLYFYQEGKVGLKKRVKAWLHYYGVESLPSTIRFITVPVHLTHDREYILNSIEDQDTPPALVVVDTFSNCAPGVRQNNQEEVYPILAVGHEIAKEYGSHFMFIHHDNKSGDYNGSKAFRNHVDTMLLVEKGTSDGSIILSSKKSREEEAFSDIALQLLKVDLGDELTSCIVVGSDAKTTGTLPQPQFQILEILHESGSLASNEWYRRCEKAYRMIYMTWNRHRKALEATGLIEASQQGRGRMYTITQKGIDILTTNTTNSYSHVSDVTTNTTNTTLSSVSSVSSDDVRSKEEPLQPVSPFHIGQRVLTPKGEGKVKRIDEKDHRVSVAFSPGVSVSYHYEDVTPLEVQA